MTPSLPNRAQLAFDQRLERYAGALRQQRTEGQKAQVAVDHAFARRRDARLAQRERFDVLVEQRAVVGAAAETGRVREDHAQRGRTGQRCIEVEHAARDERQRNGRDEDLGDRSEIETRVGIDGSAAAVAERAGGAFVHGPPAAFDAHDRR